MLPRVVLWRSVIQGCLMSLPNEVSATLTLQGWRQGVATGGGVAPGQMVGWGGRAFLQLSAWHCPFLLQSSSPTIHGVSLQNHLQDVGRQEFPGRRLDVQHLKNISRPHRAHVSFNSMGCITSLGGQKRWRRGDRVGPSSN